MKVNGAHSLPNSPVNSLYTKTNYTFHTTPSCIDWGPDSVENSIDEPPGLMISLMDKPCRRVRSVVFLYLSFILSNNISMVFLALKLDLRQLLIYMLPVVLRSYHQLHPNWKNPLLCRYALLSNCVVLGIPILDSMFFGMSGFTLTPWSYTSREPVLTVNHPSVVLRSYHLYGYFLRAVYLFLVPRE